MGKVNFTIRLKPSTIKDLESFAKIKGYPSKSTVIRYFLNLGFSSHGNWRLGK
jgi:hypothetical protein